jgi:hypothetical protein
MPLRQEHQKTFLYVLSGPFPVGRYIFAEPDPNAHHERVSSTANCQGWYLLNVSAFLALVIAPHFYILYLMVRELQCRHRSTLRIRQEIASAGALFSSLAFELQTPMASPHPAAGSRCMTGVMENGVWIV